MTTEVKDRVLEGVIVNGPNRWDLILKALADGKRGSFIIKFPDIERANELDLKICSVTSEFQFEDNNDWFIGGILIKSKGWCVIRSEFVFPDNEADVDVCFVASYRTMERKGTIKFKIMPSAIFERALFNLF